MNAQIIQYYGGESECENPINIEEYNFIYENVLKKIQKRNFRIDETDALVIFTLENTYIDCKKNYCTTVNSIQCFGNSSFSRYNKTIKRLFNKNIGTNTGYGITYHDYNFSRGGKGDDCCCFNIYILNSNKTDSILPKIPISKFFFDYICKEMAKCIKKEFIDYERALIICRIYNTIKMYNLNNRIYNNFMKKVKLLKYQKEIKEFLEYGNKDYPFPLSNFGEVQKKASSYEIVDIQNPTIKYTYK